ncbi:MAG: hypothetical protein K8T26_10105 [Lentisphaerae bacterium]|nr:hypothetical protein [Lentisphaerota bacterium]
MTQYEILYFLFRNKWLILTGVIIGVIAAGVVYTVKPPTYRSEAKLLVRYVSDTVAVDPSVTGERVLTPGRAGDEVLTTEVDILTSAEIIGTVAKALADENAANTNRTDVALTGHSIALSFNVQAAKNSNMLGLYFDGPTPEIAQRVLRRLIDAYLMKHQEVHRDPGAFDFIARQTDEMRTRVNDTEDELRRIKNQAGITSLTETRQSVLARIQDLDKAIRESEGALAATRARIQSLSEQINALTGTASSAANTNRTNEVQDSPAVDSDSLRRLTDLYRRETELLSTYTSNSIPVRSVRAQIDMLRSGMLGLPAGALPATPRIGGSPAEYPVSPALALTAEYAGYKAEETAIVARQEVLRKQMEAAQADSRRIEASEAQISRLDRTREIYDTNFRYFSQRLEQARIDNAMEASKVSNIAVVQAPTFADRPLYKELQKLLAGVLAACSACGMAVALAREFLFDHSIRHPFTIPRVLNVPLLAVLPRLRRPGARRRSEVLLGDTSVDARTAQSWLASCEVMAQIIRHVANREPGRTLRVGITAPHHGAGVSLVAGKIADAIHMSGSKNVLLATVSANGLLAARDVGAASADIEAEEVVSKPAQVQGEAEEWTPVRIPFSAPAPITPRMMDELDHQDHDVILYDLPPLEGTEHTVRLLEHLDGVILVVETFRTTISEAHACLALMQQLHCPVYGVALNKFASPLGGWISPPPTPPAAPPPVAALPPGRPAESEE